MVTQNADTRALKPFIHKVATEGGRYIFDVNTGEILRVDDVVWEIVEDSYLREAEVIAKHTPRFTPDQIATAYHEISEARSEEGYFSNEHPTVGMALGREDIDRALGHERTLLFLEVTERCNYQCTYCNRHYQIPGVARHGTRDMDWETARAALDDFLRHCHISQPRDESERSLAAENSELLKDTIHVGFYGGEPLLNFPLIKRCTEYVQNKVKEKARFGLTTNGALLTGDIARYLGTHNFLVTVSLDGPASLHDRNRRTKGGQPTHQVVFDNLRAFLREYPRQISGINAVVARGTDIRDVYRYFASADWVPPTTLPGVAMASPPYPGYHRRVPGVEPFPGYREMYKDFKEDLAKGRIGVDVDRLELRLMQLEFRKKFEGLHCHRWRVAQARKRQKPFAPPGPCPGGTVRTFVSVTGDYFACEKILPRAEYRVGNVTMGVDGERGYRLLQEFIECTRQECEQCWCLPICSIGCHASVCDENGFSLEAKRRACAKARDSLHHSLQDYCSVLERNPQAFDFLDTRAVPA